MQDFFKISVTFHYTHNAACECTETIEQKMSKQLAMRYNKYKRYNTYVYLYVFISKVRNEFEPYYSDVQGIINNFYLKANSNNNFHTKNV